MAPLHPIIIIRFGFLAIYSGAKITGLIEQISPVIFYLFKFAAICRARSYCC